MTRIARLSLAFLLLAALGSAQPPPRIYWEHDGANLTHFECQIESSARVNLSGLVTQNGTTYDTALSNCGTLATGAQLLYIYACNGGLCTTAPGIWVVKTEARP